MYFIIFSVFLSVASAQGTYELNILHYNDFHARFVETSPFGAVCNPEQAPCIGGFARLTTAVRAGLEREPHSLVLNGGDSFQGTIWYNILRWNVTQDFMNMFHHDAHVLGNHEFDNGIEGVVPYLEHLEAPVVTANIIDDEEPKIQGLYHPSIVVEKNGRRIGIIGVIIASTNTLASTGRLQFTDEVETVRTEAQKLHEQGIDIIVVLSHCGLDIDRDIALRGGPHIDIIVGGHSHTLLYNEEPPESSAFRPQGPYPVVVEQGNKKVLIVQAAAHTAYLGEIKLYFDDDGNLLEWEGNPHYLANEIVQAPDVFEKIEYYLPMVDELARQEVGTSLVHLGASCTCGECNLGSFICDAFMHAVMSKAEDSNWHYAHFCVINQGNVRVGIEPGVVTFESMLLSTPFENNVEVFKLRGDHIMEMLEYSVANDPYPGARMVQVSGLQVVFNGALPVNSRVVTASVRCIDCSVPRYEPLRLDRNYTVVSQNFMAEGGDGYFMISDNRFDVEVIGVDYELLMDYIRHQSPIDKDEDGRVLISNPFVETSPFGTVCNPEQAPCIGGFARLTTAVRAGLEREPHSLVLNGGDSFQGTIWYNILRWNVTQDFMNIFHHDAHVLGNHEFDNGIEGVVPYLEHLEAPVVTANIIDDEEPTIQGLYQPSIVVEKNGRRIGIIGVIIASTDTLASTGRLQFTDEVETVRTEARKLHEQGIDIIVVLSHCGLDIDRDIALHGGPYIDIIVGGHSHTLLYNEDPPESSAFVPQGPYPVVVEQDNRKVLIVQAAAHTAYLGEIKLYFDDDGNLLEWEGNPHYLANEIEQAPDVLEKIEYYLPRVDELAKQEVGSSLVHLRSSCACGECNLGSFICDAFMHAVMPMAEEENWHFAHFCVINQGGIRVDIEPGVITFESMLLSTPFENNVEVFQLRGDHIMEMLEFSVANDPYPGARMVQVSGLQAVFDGAQPVNRRVVTASVRCIDCSVPRYEPLRLDRNYTVVSQTFMGEGGDGFSVSGIRTVFDGSRPVGSRVVSASVRCIDCAVPRYDPVDTNKFYRMVTTDFIGAGGGDYTMISDNRFDVRVVGVDYELLMDYIQHQSPVFKDEDGRVLISNPCSD